jgi:N-methylhydantoinase A
MLPLRPNPAVTRRVAGDPGPGVPLSVGIDTGGTFTDVVVLDSRSGALMVTKFPTGSDPAGAVRAAMAGLSRAEHVRFIAHATTLATNALLTGAGLPRIALVTNDGFRDLLEIGRQRRPEIYDLNTRRAPPLVKRKDRLTVKCRISAEGEEVAKLDSVGALRVARYIRRQRFSAVAICFLNSYINPKHELEMKEALNSAGYAGHVSVSSEVDREYREYERFSTTAVNACLSPLVASYLGTLESDLLALGVKAPLYMMNSDGGMGTARAAASRPVGVVESGPAAGVLAARQLARTRGASRVLSFDMGGTTAKAGTIIDGEPDLVNEFEAAGRTHSGRSVRGSGYAVRGRFVDIAEVSAGGGTVAWVDEEGGLAVGPRSAGSAPGPACYGSGGKEATVTDANVVLGRISPTHLLGGRMAIHKELAETAVGIVAQRLDLTVQETALGIIRLANNSMAKAIAIVSVERGRDPREYTMIAFGGAGPAHCCDLAEELGIRDVLVPIHSGLFSAYGLLTADISRWFTLPLDRSGSDVEAKLNELKKLAQDAMTKDDLHDYGAVVYIDVRYRGQSHELTIPYRGPGEVAVDFRRRHRELYGYSSDDPIEAVNLRMSAVAKRDAKLPSVVPVGRRGAPSRRSAFLGAGLCDAQVLVRENLRDGETGRGPSIIEEYDSTLVVNPGWRWRADRGAVRLWR